MELSVKEYAEFVGISQQAVYQKIKAGTLKTEIENGRTKIIFDENEVKKAEQVVEQVDSTALTSALKELETLKMFLSDKDKQIEELRKDKHEMNERLKESNVLQLRALETVKMLEHKTETVEQELKSEKSKKWFQKIFAK